MSYQGRYRKKPVVIEAWRVPKRGEEPTYEMVEFVRQQGWEGDSEGISIPTKEGVMLAMPGDYIIKGVVGEYYPCKPDIFALTYEAAE